jgi:hypothetical protein
LAELGQGLPLGYRALVNYLNKEPGWYSAEDYNCWDQAILEWKNLASGQPGASGYDPNLGVPPNDGDPCTWDVPDYTDVEDLADWSMIVIDASHSMELDANGTKAWEYAVDAAEYFNQVAVDKGTKAGVYAFGDELWPVQWMSNVNDMWITPQPGAQEMVLGAPVDLQPDDVALYANGVGDYVDVLHVTNLCAVLEGAKDAFEHSGAPRGDREVVLLTDGGFSRRADFVDDDNMVTCRGVVEWIDQAPEIANEICSEAGMRVNVVSTGANPKLELAEWLALLRRRRSSQGRFVAARGQGVCGNGKSQGGGPRDRAARASAARSLDNYGIADVLGRGWCRGPRCRVDREPIHRRGCRDAGFRLPRVHARVSKRCFHEPHGQLQ